MAKQTQGGALAVITNKTKKIERSMPFHGRKMSNTGIYHISEFLRIGNP